MTDKQAEQLKLACYKCESQLTYSHMRDNKPVFTCSNEDCPLYGETLISEDEYIAHEY